MGSMWGRCRVDVGLMLGRCRVDVRKKNKMRENIKIVLERIKKIEEGNVVKKDSLLSLPSLIDFF